MARHSVQPGTHTHVDRGADLYETPACATEALLRAENIPHSVWECAAGRGAIVKVLRDREHTVIASDLVDYGFPLHFVGDFLAQTKAPAGCECILTNPPFRIVDRFIAPRAQLVSARDHARTPGVARIRSAHRDPGAPRARARSCVSREAPHDAPRRLGRAASFKRDAVRVVRMELRTPRPDRRRQNFSQ